MMQAAAAEAAAAEALENLDKKDIDEIKGMASPPAPVMIVCMCVVILRPLGKEDESYGWTGAKAMLSDMSLLKALQDYKKDEMKDRQIKRLKQLLAKVKTDVEAENMLKISKAGHGLLCWVKAMVAYYEVAKERILEVHNQRLAKEEVLINDVDDVLINDVDDVDPDIARDLAKAGPALDAVVHALDELDEKSVAEVKQYAKPPELLLKTMNAVMTVMDKRATWASAKNELRDVNFLQKLKTFKKNEISNETLKKINEYTRDSTFQPQIVQKRTRSILAGVLCMWVHAIKMYADVFREAGLRRKMMKEHFLNAISDLFTMLDKNKNRVIDKIEQEEAMKQIHSMALPKARWTWSAMDTDGDGKISENEFQEGLQAISDKVGEEQLLDCIIRAWPDHPLALEKAKEEKDRQDLLDQLGQVMQSLDPARQRQALIAQLKEEIALLENLPPATLQHERMQEHIGALYERLGELEKA
jgi:hypothetical protein